MRTPWPNVVLSAVLLLSPLGISAPAAWAQAAVPAVTTARVIVKYRADSPLLRRSVLVAKRSADRAQQLGLRVGHSLRAGTEMTERMHVVHATGLSSEALAAKLARQSDVEYAVPDRRRHALAAPNDPRYAQGLGGAGPAAGQWYLRPPTSTLVSAINAEAAWDVSLTSATVVVAVLDSGVRYEHEDLGSNVLPGYDMVGDDDGTPGVSTSSTYGIANDRNGYDADASDPGDWVSSSDVANGSVFADCATEDSSWHGTQTAGLIGALTNNGLGMAGVGNNRLKVLPVRVLGKCGGFDSDITNGMRWAAGLSVSGVPDNPVANRARVLNLSLGGDGVCSQPYLDALRELAALDVVVVASAGNSGGHALGVPANCPGVIAVGGLRHAGSKGGYSDLGANVVVSAPMGNCVNTSPGSPCLYPILSATNAGATSPSTGASAYTDATNYGLGTSFAAPLVAGTAGLMLSANPALTALQVKQLLQATARTFPSTGGTAGTVACRAPRYTSSTGDTIDQDECYCTANTCGAGMLDAAVAVQRAASGPLAPDVRARIDVRVADSRATDASDMDTAIPLATRPLDLTAQNSVVDAARTITAYQWTLVSGGGIVSSISNPTTRDARVTPSGAGSFTVRLRVTDSAAAVSTVDATVTVAPWTVPMAPLIATDVDSGGGATGIGWQLGLLAGTLALLTLRYRNALRRRLRPVRARVR